MNSIQPNDDMTIIKFNDLIFYKINNSWWEVIEEKIEKYSTGSQQIETIVPVIRCEVSFDYIKKTYLRNEKFKRLIDE